MENKCVRQMKDEHYFLNGLALQLANISPTAKKETVTSTTVSEIEKYKRKGNSRGFGIV